MEQFTPKTEQELLDQIHLMRQPCRCDPLGSGEEYCNGGCELRALLRQALLWIKDFHSFLDAGDPDACHTRIWIETTTKILEAPHASPASESP